MLQKITIATIVLLTLVSFAAAQVAPTAATSVAIAGAPMRGPAIALRTELMDTAPIKGSPFCATVVNEHTQTFADG
ncbi:MAG TPA: hypothetical protein VG897_01725, partial [Terriglobales bacterium]|nr:hypothetical protein [Terriglobales bacterium]